jgi:heptosyltransferase I
VNVALVKLSSLGDVVHALPVAATLRARVPQARITWIVERREAAVLAGHPALERIVTVDTRRWRRARTPGELAAASRAILAVRRDLSSTRFDVALDLQGLIKSGLLVRLTGAPLRVGFDRGWCRERLSALATNRRVMPPAHARHVVDQYLSLLGALGIDGRALEFRLPSDSAAEARMDEFFASAGLKPRDRVVVLNPGAGRPDKRWPIESFRALAEALTAGDGSRVVVVWGPGEETDARAIADAAGSHVLLAPPTDLLALIALLRRAGVVVAADTGPLHLAAALGTPCVGLYGPTRAERNGPYGAGHRTFQAADGRVESIGVDAVVAAARELLG